jgi:uroporphyrinogen decarboxylase
VDQKPVKGSEEELRAEVRRRIDALAPGGGYILATSNVIVDPLTGNIPIIFEEAHSYGRYLLRG